MKYQLQTEQWKNVFFLKIPNIKIVDWANLENSLKEYDIIINATSLGLKNGENFDFDFKFIKDNLIYIDTIYNPLETKPQIFKRKRKKSFQWT